MKELQKKSLSAVTSEIGGSFASFIGGIIGNYVGEGITKGVDRMCGFKELDTGSSIFDKLNSALGNILSVTGDFDKIKGLKGSYIKAAENISKVSKVFGYLFTAADLGTSIMDGKEVAKNTLIGSFFGKSLSSTSHENVCALYIYAKTRFEGLINSGDVNFSYSWDGNVKSYFYKSDAINQVKDELLLLKSALEDQNYE